MTFDAVPALCFYDYLLTFPWERRLIWQRKLSFASLLFLINRYCIILENALIIVTLLLWEGQDTWLNNIVSFRPPY
ncbi:hypothetical protein BDY19DRAFT_900581 [Irpex rosettiformis]|uniref:Uncharacterized protein n=1 Tax=Irpex rosettiformis TaxID=378272 RepID=A0ACB8TMK5_9APHY|nr:hypothetical protein BDY19DRAFT_900581 [Irpex rosettiformis]